MKTRRSGLGLSSLKHKGAAKDYSIYFTDSLRVARRDLAHGTVGACASALTHFADAARAAGSAHCHRASRGVGKALRTVRTSFGMNRALGKLRQEYVDRCVRK